MWLFWCFLPFLLEKCSSIGIVSPTKLNKLLQLKISNGLIQGKEEKSLNGIKYFSYVGIPYAEPPINDLRFRAPVQISNWSTVLDATVPGFCCAGLNLPKLMGSFHLQPYGEEDCLYLNVYTPREPIEKGLKKPLAVMVYFYGGGFISGCGNEYKPDFLMEDNVVYVVPNFRISVFGYLSTGDMECPGNWAAKDQIEVLKWVKLNIHAFGGDSKKVTIFGQSAGAANVNTLLLAQRAKGLFHIEVASFGEAETNVPKLYTQYAIRSYQSMPPEDIVTSSLAAVLGHAPKGTHGEVVRDVLNSQERKADDKKTVMFVGICIMAKPLTRNPDNGAYLMSRWKAYCSGKGYAITDMLSPAIRKVLEEFQISIQANPKIRNIWIEATLDATSHPLPDLQSQILLVWRDYGMRSYNIMLNFTRVPSLALANDTVYDQVTRFRTEWNHLVSIHGQRTPYLAIMGANLSGLHHRAYPDLYYCALHRAMKGQTLGATGRYVISDVETHVSKPVLEKLSRPMSRAMGAVASEVAAERLATLD